MEAAFRGRIKISSLKSGVKRNKNMTKIPAAFAELIGWLKPICLYDKIEDFVIADYKEKMLHLKIFTKDHQYRIGAKLPEVKNDGWPLQAGQEREVVNNGYLGCISETRKPRAGEDWSRGNDLVDGSYSKETFEEIVHDILAYELVKVIKPRSRAVKDSIAIGGKEKIEE